MAPPLLTLRDIHLTFGGTPLLTGADLFIHERERLCLVGRNGSGKSTLMKIAAGSVEHDKGERMIRPGTTIRYLEQEPDFSPFATTRAFAEAGLTEGDDPHRITWLMEQVGLTGEEDPKHLSGGEMRRAALIRALAPDPDILLLDEPTNHLDLPVIDWLEQELGASRAALVLISHDRRFLENMTQRTVWLDRGITREMNKGFSAFEEWRDEVLAAEELEQHKIDRKIVREEHWLTYGVTARRKRNQRRLKDLHSLRQQRKDHAGPQGGVKLEALESGPSGKQVIDAEAISKSYDNRTIINNFSIKINRGDRVGFAGPNGSGKTTLLKMLIGALPPDEGTIKLGTTLDILTLDQKRANLAPSTRLMDALTGGKNSPSGGGDMITIGGKPRHVMSYLKDFLFSAEQARTPISALSGGERGRLALAIALAQPSNLLVLDEPTNDLDLETLDLLQEMLSAYEGTVLLVSHDRDFLDRTVTSTLTPEGNGVWREYPGGYTDMMRQKKAAQSDTVPAKTNVKSPSPSTKQPPKTGSAKLSYKEKYALESLPKEMAALQKKIDTYKEKMADPDLFTKNPDEFHKIVKALEEAETTLAQSEEQWLELEMKREELES